MVIFLRAEQIPEWMWETVEGRAKDPKKYTVPTPFVDPKDTLTRIALREPSFNVKPSNDPIFSIRVPAFQETSIRLQGERNENGDVWLGGS